MEELLEQLQHLNPDQRQEYRGVVAALTIVDPPLRTLRCVIGQMKAYLQRVKNRERPWPDGLRFEYRFQGTYMRLRPKQILALPPLLNSVAESSIEEVRAVAAQIGPYKPFYKLGDTKATRGQLEAAGWSLTEKLKKYRWQHPNGWVAEESTAMSALLAAAENYELVAQLEYLDQFDYHLAVSQNRATVFSYRFVDVLPLYDQILVQTFKDWNSLISLSRELKREGLQAKDDITREGVARKLALTEGRLIALYDLLPCSDHERLYERYIRLKYNLPEPLFGTFNNCGGGLMIYPPLYQPFTPTSVEDTERLVSLF